jgi:hypothetical protein
VLAHKKTALLEVQRPVATNMKAQPREAEVQPLPLQKRQLDFRRVNGHDSQVRELVGQVPAPPALRGQGRRGHGRFGGSSMVFIGLAIPCPAGGQLPARDWLANSG